MTEGGTSEEDRFRDPSLPDPTMDPARPRQGQPPREVTDAEVALVRRRYEEAQGMPLPEIIATFGEAYVRTDLPKFLVKETML